MKRPFSTYWFHTLVALSATMASGVYAAGSSIPLGGNDNISLEGGSGGSISPGGTISPGGSTGTVHIANVTINGSSGSLRFSSGLTVGKLVITGKMNLNIQTEEPVHIGSYIIRNTELEENANNLSKKNIHIGSYVIENSNVSVNSGILLTESVGSMTLKEASVLQGQGLTMTEGADTTLKLINSTLSQSGYDVNVYAANTLSAEGVSYLTADTLNMFKDSNLELNVNSVNDMNGSAVLTARGQMSLNDVSLNLVGTEFLTDGKYKLLTNADGTNLDISGWNINGIESPSQLCWENGTLYYLGGYDWNHSVNKAEDIEALEEILGNLIINGGDITLDDFVKAIEDNVNTGHIIINNGGIHITGSGNLDGNIKFKGNLRDAYRKLLADNNIKNLKIDLDGGTENENIVEVSADTAMEVTALNGEGGMSKTGEGEMIIVGNGHEVGGTMAVQEGQVTFAAGDEISEARNNSATQIFELIVGNEEGKETKVNIGKNAQVQGSTLLVDGSQATVTNEGSLVFQVTVQMTNGHLDNQGSISKVTMNGGTVSGSGTFNGLSMDGGVLVVGNSPGLQTYTDDTEIKQGSVIFSLANADTAATADTKGWESATYSTIDMQGNKLTLGAEVNFVIELGGMALEELLAQEGATLTFDLALIQHIHSDSLTLNGESFAALLGNTSIIVTSDLEGLSDSTKHMAGKDITYMLGDAAYSYEGNTLVFRGTLTNIVPEPTTATLSLLALAGLAARRRRR